MHSPIGLIRLSLVALATALLATCAGESVVDRSEVRTIGVVKAPTAEFPLAVWGDRPNLLEFETSGEGTVSIEFRDEVDRELKRIELPSSVNETSHSLELPGTGVRIFKLVVQADPSVEFSELRLRSYSAPAVEGDALIDDGDALRDVVVFVPDSLAARHLKCYGYERDTCPNLDQLAEEGTRFESAYSQTSWTLSSVTSLFTSVEQERHGVLKISNVLGDQLTTMAELFQRRGYRTLGLIQNGVIWRPTGLARGFDEYLVFEWSPEGMQQLINRAHAELGEPDRPPIFLYVHLTPPHGPYDPPDEMRSTLVDPTYSGPHDGSIESLFELSKREVEPSDADVRHVETLYDAHIRYADDVLGRLIQPMRDGRSRRKGIVAFTSDHGEAFFEHGVQGHNPHVYEEMVHVPLVLWSSDRAFIAGQVIEGHASLLDLLPTFVDVFGLGGTKQDLQGRSLARQLVAGRSSEGSLERPLFISSRHTDDSGALHRAVRLGEHKLIVRKTPAGRFRHELYDMNEDPRERVNLAGEHPIRVAALEFLLNAWDQEVRVGAFLQGVAVMDPERKAEIQALGYTGAEILDE